MLPNLAYNPINDALFAASKENTRNNDRIAYGRGVLVGLVAGIMSNGEYTFDQACRVVINHGEGDNDIDLNPQCIPPGKQWGIFKRLVRS